VVYSYNKTSELH